MAKNYPAGTPVWVDMSTPDIESTVRFYTGLFGWTADEGSPETGGYRQFRKEGQPVAAAAPPMNPDQPPPPAAWITYFATDDVEAASAAVEVNGGKILMAPTQVMDLGKMAIFADPAGAEFAVWQAGDMPGFAMSQAPATVGWCELLTPNLAGAEAFYPAVLPVQPRTVDMGAPYLLLQVGGQAVAGAMQQTPDMPITYPTWTVYLNVNDCDATVASAQDLGATVLVPPTDAPAGRLAYLRDPQGAHFAVIRPNPDFSI